MSHLPAPPPATTAASTQTADVLNLELGKRPGMLGLLFRKAQNKIQDPAKLRRLIVDLIDKEEWSSLDADVKGDAYPSPEGVPIDDAIVVMAGGRISAVGPRAAVAVPPGATVIDVGYLPNFDHAIEYDLMAAAGLGWREMLASLTVSPAERFGEGARRGRVAAGFEPIWWYSDRIRRMACAISGTCATPFARGE